MIEAFLRQAIKEEVQNAMREIVEAIAKAPAPQPKADRRFISTREAAEIAAVNEKTIRAWIAMGKLRRYQAGRELRVERGDLERFMAGDDMKEHRANKDSGLIARELYARAAGK